MLIASLVISFISLTVSVLAMNVAVRNPEIHIYHEPEDKDKSLS